MRERVVLLSTWGGGHELPECRVLGWALVVMGRVNRAVRTRTARKVSQYFTNRVAHGMHRSRIHSRHPLPGIRRSAPASAIRATVACAPLWYFDFEWVRCTLKGSMRPASLEIKSDLVPKFWADPEVAHRGGSDGCAVGCAVGGARRRWLPRGAERRGEILSL